MNNKEFLEKYGNNKIEWELLEFWTEIYPRKYTDSYMSFSHNYGAYEIGYCDYEDAIYLKNENKNDGFIGWRYENYDEQYLNHKDFPYDFPQDYINEFLQYVAGGDIILN